MFGSVAEVPNYPIVGIIMQFSMEPFLTRILVFRLSLIGLVTRRIDPLAKMVQYKKSVQEIVIILVAHEGSYVLLRFLK